MTDFHGATRFHTVVIGGGQAGLSVGYHLARQGRSFVILDANPRIGDAWRNRWDSLRLFTPAQYVRLPGLPFPSREVPFPSKDQMADYVESYAAHFRLPVQTGTKVDKLSQEDDSFLIAAGNKRFEAENVVVAMANYQVPTRPAFAGGLDSAIVQLHSHDYKNPSQLREGGVLVVGVGNSGADIGLEVARSGHETWLSGKESGHIPFPIDTFIARHIAFRVVRFIGHHILTLGTPMGRKARPKMLAQASPLVRVKPHDLVQAGIKRVDRVAGVQDGRPLLADGRVLDVKNLIWCTGYEPGFSWIDLPVFDKEDQPVQNRGVTTVPGLYFVGLHFQYAMSSATVIGVGRDAEYVVRAIHLRTSAGKRREWNLQPVKVA